MGPRFEPSAEDDAIAHETLAAAIRVHERLGPGFIETVYENALCYELDRRSIPFARQVEIPVLYEGLQVGLHRADLVVRGRVIVEMKCVECLLAIHRAQLLSYLSAAHLHLGLLINFRGAVLLQGVKRVINSRYG